MKNQSKYHTTIVDVFVFFLFNSLSHMTICIMNNLPERGNQPFVKPHEWLYNLISHSKTEIVNICSTIYIYYIYTLYIYIHTWDAIVSISLLRSLQVIRLIFLDTRSTKNMHVLCFTSHTNPHTKTWRSPYLKLVVNHAFIIINPLKYHLVNHIVLWNVDFP